MVNRIAVIEREKCINGRGCPFTCGKVCPVNRSGEECITVAGDNKPEIDENLCIGCGICVHRCPVKCISVINLPEQLTEKPIHRYGKNRFELFSLPTPVFGKVVGMIGMNGIGKSTALKILANVLTPNLGAVGKSADYDDLMHFFKGTEAQLYFEKVKAGEIKVSYKPQQIDMIPKIKSGKVRKLLEKVDEKKELDRIAETLEITEILDSDIKKVSGGELQRIAIAAAVLKRANFYIFDEPTSYLDIKQRLKIAKFIRELADEDTAVMVVEHDLIILDYMTDVVHIMYGKEGTYGVVSGPKATKAGINVYLSGYLKEENTRFRDHAIKFSAKPPAKATADNLLTEWVDIKKKFDRFELKAQKGKLYKEDVVGILGENGIGKTTFVKILAGVLKQDNDKTMQNLRVSYKPQYLETKSDETVMGMLGDAIKNYSHQLIIPLNLEPLFDKKLNELSGGELQRVAIAGCLSKDADLYLLDEPSAYLDVEQRLIIAKVIDELMEHKGATALVVDHDLLFADYLSKQLLVFEGVPAKHGEVKGPFEMENGMNLFLKDLGITFRKDPETNRPRANKAGSVKDREQKTEGKYYYV
ncbi:ribosome biogenesis/translation initiation ATPase RLI [Candidatus Woesearchaeota archaeon]|nr:ribosome biogenesis/translation initiation ATPase RLI [Candidatus Woesearchaeota archaeon]